MMPEFRGIKITRAEELARHAFRREVERALREAVRGSGWKAARGMIFREVDGWFLHFLPSVTIYWRETRVGLHVKPMGADPIFWAISDMPENNDRSLSFRAGGAWVCQTPTYLELGVDEGDMDPQGTTERILAWANSALEHIKGRLDLQGYLEFLEQSPRQISHQAYLPALISTLVLSGRTKEARDVCESALARQQNGGFLSPSGSFIAMALRWLSAHADGAKPN